MNAPRTRPNLRIVIAPAREYVISERRQAVSEFSDDWTTVDRVCSLASDEMIAADRREREGK